jgi:putative transcriptional regulator
MAKAPPITNRIRELRDAHGGMSQSALAEAIGVTRQTVIAIELGK